jgi:hypothetical protein
MFTRQDVRQTVIDHCGERPTLDNYVEAIMASRMWVKHLDEAMCREGYECLYDAIREVLDNE